MDHLKEKWWDLTSRDSRCKHYDDEAAEISFENIGGLFISIFIGICASFVALIGEYLWFSYHKRPKMIAAANAILIQRHILLHSMVRKKNKLKLYKTI